MKAVALALIIAASPAAAFERMQRADCQNAWLALVDAFTVQFLDEDDMKAQDDATEMRRVTSTVSGDGWCRLTGGTAGLEDADFTTFDWQAEGLGGFMTSGAPPLALRLRVTDLQNDGATRPAFDLTATLRQVPGDGILLIEELTLSDAGAQDAWLSVAAVVDGAYFGSKSSMITSFGGLTLRSGVARLALTPARVKDHGSDRGDVLGSFTEAIAAAESGLDDRQIDEASRDALAMLLRDLPNATGVLDIALESARGLGWMQVGAAASRAAQNPGGNMGDAMNFALSGVTVTAGWTPEAE